MKIKLFKIVKNELYFTNLDYCWLCIKFIAHLEEPYGPWGFVSDYQGLGINDLFM